MRECQKSEARTEQERAYCYNSLISIIVWHLKIAAAFTPCTLLPWVTSHWPHSYLVMSWQPRMVMIWISPGDDSSANWVRSLTTGRLDSRRVRRAFWFAAVLTEIIWGPSSRARLSLLAKCIANNLTREIAMPTDKHRHFIYFHYALNVLHYLLSRNISG